MKSKEIEHRGDTYILDTQEKQNMFNEMLELEKHLHKPATECLNELIRVIEIRDRLLHGKSRQVIHINLDKDGNTSTGGYIAFRWMSLLNTNCPSVI